jgi:putative membrane protein
MYLLLTFMVVGFYACDDDDEVIDDGLAVVSEQDEDFAMNASYSNRAEIELGELASTKATNESVRAFAEMMVEHHTMAQNQLKEIASDLNIAIPDTLDAAHQTLQAQLSDMSGYQFDSAYIRSQVMDHELAQQLMETEMEEGENDSLVSYATQTLPIINQHLEEALEIQTALTAEADGNTDDGDTDTDNG